MNSSTSTSTSLSAESMLAGQAADANAVDPVELAIIELAKLPSLEYEQKRKDAAKALGIRPAVLDAEAKKHRPAKPAATTSSLPYSEPTPWSEPVDGSELLGDIATTINRYVVLAAHVDVALSLFVVTSYAIEHFDAAPYLHITSPEKRCGKSLLLRILVRLCWRSLPAGSCTESALFRSIDKECPTLFIDEVDAFFGDREELRGILNSGNIRDDAAVMRVEESTVNGTREMVVRRFTVFCMKVFAGIGKIADTLADRSIQISMRRKKPEESRARFRRRTFNVEHLRQKCRRWAVDNGSALAAATPALPDALNDRAADLWEPMLAVADAIGGDWPQRARDAAVALSGDSSASNPTLGVLLLGDIYNIFIGGADKVSSADLCAKLAAIEERPWNEIHHGKAITPNRLARMLANYGVASRKVRLTDGVKQGYTADDFADAWERYTLPTLADLKRNNGTSSVKPRENEDSEVEQAQTCSVSKNNEKPCSHRGCSTVPLQNVTRHDI